MKQQTSKPDKKPRRTHQVDEEETESYVSGDPDAYPMFNIQAKRSKPLLVTLQLNQQTLSMELDTGASLSIINDKTYKSLWSTQQPLLEDTNIRLHTYTKETIRVLGQIIVVVTYKEQVRMLPLLVVAGEGLSLFGRDWLAELLIYS